MVLFMSKWSTKSLSFYIYNYSYKLTIKYNNVIYYIYTIHNSNVFNKLFNTLIYIYNEWKLFNTKPWLEIHLEKH